MTTQLEILAVEIKKVHKKVRGSVRTTLNLAKQAGELLLKARDLCGYAEWEPWLTSNCSIQRSTAANYMRIAKQWHELPEVDELSISEALKLLTRIRKVKVKPTTMTLITREDARILNLMAATGIRTTLAKMRAFLGAYYQHSQAA